MPVGKQHTDFTIAVSAPVAVDALPGRPDRAAPVPRRRRLCLAVHQPSRRSTTSAWSTPTRCRARRRCANCCGSMCRRRRSVAARQLEGLTSIACHPIVRRIPGAGPIAVGTRAGTDADDRRGAVRRRRRHPARRRARPFLRQIRLDQRLHRNGAAQPRARRGDAMADAAGPAPGRCERPAPEQAERRRRAPRAGAVRPSGWPRRRGAGASSRRCGGWRRRIADRPRLGRSVRPAQDALRLAQEPSVDVRPGDAGRLGAGHGRTRRRGCWCISSACSAPTGRCRCT